MRARIKQVCGFYAGEIKLSSSEWYEVTDWRFTWLSAKLELKHWVKLHREFEI